MVDKLIGSYKILSQIGEGGMGVVYLAEHRYLGRKAAIKVLLKQLAERTDLLERFFAEARATSQIEHPGIVQIFDCEVDSGGQPYIVMEFLTGETLAAVLRRRTRLEPVEAISLARQAADALAAAHDKGIVHRDMKPDNVFVLATTPATVKIVDFGIAKLAGGLRGNITKTQTGIMMGTPLYMSPEQCRGAGAVDHRTDIYSLGAVFYEMLTGRPPFVYEGVGELVAAHLTEQPAPVRSLAPDVPEGAAALVAQALAKRPSDRPATMRELAERLAAMDSLTPVTRSITGSRVPSVAPSAPSAGTTQPPRMTRTAGDAVATGPGPRITAARVSGASGSWRGAGTRATDTTFGSSAGERTPADSVVGARRRGGLLLGIGGGAVAGVVAVVLALSGSGSSKRSAGEAPAAAHVAIEKEAVPAQPAVAAPATAATPPAIKPAAPVSASAPPAETERAKPAAAAKSPERPATEPRRRVTVTIETQPPGAELCLASDRKILGSAPRAVELPADGKKRAFFLRLAGHRLEEVTIKSDKDQRRAVRLTALGPDDLEAASPCR